MAAVFLDLEIASKTQVEKANGDLKMTAKCVHSRAYYAARKAALARGKSDVDLPLHA